MNHRKEVKMLVIYGAVQASSYALAALPLVLLGGHDENLFFFASALLGGYYSWGWLGIIFLDKCDGEKMNCNDTRNHIPPCLVIVGALFWVGFILFLVFGT